MFNGESNGGPGAQGHVRSRDPTWELVDTWPVPAEVRRELGSSVGELGSPR